MKYHARLLNFEGPLDLLLQLIEQSRLEITDISLAEITDQYLRYVDQLPNLKPTELNQFIDVAARLIQLKSQVLLPDTRPTKDDQTELDSLAEQLATYQKYQHAASYVRKLIEAKPASWSRPVQPAIIKPESLPLAPITQAQLEQAFKSIIQRQPKLKPQKIAAQIGVGEMILKIRQAISEQTEVSLQSLALVASNRTEAVVLFLAVLELLRQNQISASQDQAFGAIMVRNG